MICIVPFLLWVLYITVLFNLSKSQRNVIIPRKLSLGEIP